MTDKKMPEGAENTEILVTLICPDGHEWPTTATEAGMATPVSGHPNEYVRPLVFAADTCDKCKQRGTLKP